MIEISLYFHVPFCSRKCDYCHFYVIPSKPAYHAQLMDGLRMEWEAKRSLLEDKKIVSIYFGGGTPFLLGAERIGQIISWVKTGAALAPDLEVTLEANPEHLSKEAIVHFAAAGINRLSLGIQSLDNDELKLLGREHDASRAISAVEQTIAGGIANLSIDLMYDLPSQTTSHWEKTLQTALKLPITHLSLYNLTFEPHTVFYKRREKLQKLLPKEEESRAMYERAIALCQAHDFIQYEISAFARQGYYSRHNCGYWLGRPFLGFGPSAFSYWNGSRFRNTPHLNRWLEALNSDTPSIDYTEKLEEEASKRELLAIGLRLCRGVDLTAFEADWGGLDLACRKQLAQLRDLGYLIEEENHLKLTAQGRLFYDTVAAEII